VLEVHDVVVRYGSIEALHAFHSKSSRARS